MPGHSRHPSFGQMNQAGPLLVAEAEEAVEEQIVQAQVASEGRQT